MKTILDNDGIRHEVPERPRFNSASWVSANCGKIVSKINGRDVEHDGRVVTCIRCASGQKEPLDGFNSFFDTKRLIDDGGD